jgi:chromosome segregation ATPase
MRLERDANWNKYQETLKELDEIKPKYEHLQKEIIDLKTRVTEAEGRADARKNAFEDYAELLKCEANIESIRESIKTAISREYEASKEVLRLGEYVEDLEQKHKEKVDFLLNEIGEWKLKLSAEADKNQNQADNFEKRIKQIQKEAVEQVTFSTIVKRLVNNLKKLG